MTDVLRGFLKLLAVLTAAAPFILAALFLLGEGTSLAVVAPNGIWLFAAILVVPLLLGIAIWRLAALIR